MMEAYAAVHGVDEDDKFVITIHERDTDTLQVKFRINNCTKFTVKIMQFVEEEASKRNYNVVEWR
jgi:hypothetical protein